ncbi:MAG: hypothetical protein ACTHK7_15135 [Aureliella sp.]
MMIASLQEERLQTVREFVREELCEKNQLEKNAFQMTERVLVKKGQPCGLFFCIYGPRSVRLTAVWDLDRGSVFFYDSLGRRSASYPTPDRSACIQN